MPTVDEKLFLDCIHCGLCLSSCPTYQELGTEMDSPRGRIYLMRAVSDGRLPVDAEVERHLDLCLDCRACETACPSGVQYHKIIEPFRAGLTRTKSLPWLQRLVLRHLFPYRFRDRLALTPARWVQQLGLDDWLRRIGFYKLLPRSLRQMHDMLPALAKPNPTWPELLPAEGPRRAKVGLFLGCVGDAVYPQTTAATIGVLRANGCDVWIAPGQGCCGALAYHGNEHQSAKKFAQANLAAFTQSVDAIISNAAGCGAMLKEYDALLPGDPPAESFSRKVRDISEFLMELGPINPKRPLRMMATYHDACHLRHAQKIVDPPRQLLKLIPELELFPLEETELCCGAAGSYNLTEPEMADRLGERKANNILATGADAVFTANVGCMMQVTKHLRAKRPDIWVAHPVEALWRAYQ